MAYESFILSEYFNENKKYYLSAQIQKDCIKLISNEFKNVIRKKLEETNFIPIVADETINYIK